MTVAPPGGPLLGRLRPHDPDAAVRHRAVRTTIGLTATFALGVLVLDSVAFALFASFGSFAVLGMADLGGETGPRIRAQLVLLATGAVLVAVGSLAAPHVLVAALVLAVAAFAVNLVGVFGGYFAGGGPAALLILVLAAMVPAPADEIVVREAGWVAAGLVAIVLSSLLWPTHERHRIRRAAADIADDVAAVVRAGASTPGTRDDLRGRVDALRDLYGRTGLRPAGPTERDQALVRVLDQLQRSVSFVGQLPPSAAGWPSRPGRATGAVDDAALADATATTFEHAARVLRGDDDPRCRAVAGPVRDLHRRALAFWLTGAIADRGAAAVVDALDPVFDLRVLAHTALACESDAVLAVGGTVADDGDDRLAEIPAGGAGAAGTVHRALALLRPHLRPTSVAFRNATRAALALGVAAVVADLIHAEHGFWVVLGTVTVLKSSAMRTGATALQALAGNVVGFVAAAVVLAGVGDRTPVLWVLLPVLVFLAAWAPAAVHFVVGQSAFCVMVVVLFNILVPEGWRTGLVRVESVALGAGVSLAVGLVLWPRGNRQALRRATAELYDAVATFIGAALEGMAGRPEPEVATARAGARRSELRADLALFDLLAAPTPAAVPVATWARLTGTGRSLRLAADGVRALPGGGFDPVTAEPIHHDLLAMAAERSDEVRAVGERLRSGADRTAVADPGPTLVRWLDGTDRSDRSAVSQALTAVWLVDWVRLVDRLVALDDEPVRVVAAGADTPWWR